MKVIKSLLVLIFMLAAAPSLAADSTTINQTHKLAPDAALSVSNISGAVTVHTWDKAEVRITGSLGYNSKLEVNGDANDLSIEVKKKDSSVSHWFGSDMGETTLTLMVPKGVNLNAGTVSARIRATGLEGGKLHLNSVSGNIEIDARSPNVYVNTVSGDVQLAGSAQIVNATTVSGDIRIEHVGTQAAAQSTSGDIHLAGGPLQQVSLESVSGDVYLTGTLAPDVMANMHSMSGDVHLKLGSAPQATLDATTLSGDIRSPWGTVHKPRYGPGSSLHTQIGNGKGSIQLKTLSGDVDISEGH